MGFGSIGLRASACSIACLLLAGCGHNAAAPAPVDAAAAPVVGTVVVGHQNLSRSLQIAAEFKPYQDVAVDAKVAGYVNPIYVDVGDHVHKGQLLAVLEIPELQDQIHQATAAVAQAEQGVSRAQDLLSQAQATHEAAHLDYTRLNKVIETQPGLVAQQEVDDARAKDEAAESQVAGAKAALAGAQQQLAADQANQARVQTMFAYARITAPFTGVITKRFADNGSMIQAGTTQSMPLVQLAEEDVLRLGIPVPEDDVPDIHIGTSAQVQVTALGKTFPGKVARFADQIDFQTRTMYTEIDVPNPTGALVPGMYAYATLVLQQQPNALAVPVQAINRQPSGVASVLVVTPQHRLASVNVTLGLETPDAVQVLRGLSGGEQVVVSGGNLLHAGQTVVPKPAVLPAVNGAS